MPEAATGCVAPAGSVLATGGPEPATLAAHRQNGGSTMTARVGKPAPDFEAPAFTNGEFGNIKPSDYRGQWVVLCFYPGDFTFV